MDSIETSLSHDNQKVSIAGRLERLPVTSYQTTICLIIALAWFLDCLDLGSMNYLLAALGKEFNLDNVVLGYLGSMSFVGMFIGAFLSGVLADRIGRKGVIQLAMLTWGIGGFGCALCWSVDSLFVFRFVIGLGLGAQLAAAHAFLPEFVPTKIRGQWTALMEGLSPVGIVCAGLIAWAVLPNLGWRWVFALEAIPCLWLFVLRFYVPESPRWLEAVGRVEEAEKITATMEEHVQRRTGKPLPPVTETLYVQEPEKTKIRDIFQGIYAKRTLMIWILWPAIQFGFYGINIWLGKLLVDAGYSIASSISFVTIIYVFGIIGSLAAVWLVEKVGRKLVVGLSVLMVAIMSYFYGHSANITQLYIFGCTMQFFAYIMWSSVYAYTPELYPTRLRATGCGMASSIGRLGALLGPTVVGLVLAAYGSGTVFSMAAVVFGVGALAVFILGVETKGKALEAISN